MLQQIRIQQIKSWDGSGFAVGLLGAGELSKIMANYKKESNG